MDKYLHAFKLGSLSVAGILIHACDEEGLTLSDDLRSAWVLDWIGLDCNWKKRHSGKHHTFRGRLLTSTSYPDYLKVIRRSLVEVKISTAIGQNCEARPASQAAEPKRAARRAANAHCNPATQSSGSAAVAPTHEAEVPVTAAKLPKGQDRGLAFLAALPTQQCRSQLPQLGYPITA